MSSSQPCAPPNSFLKSMKYFKCTEKYREERNAPRDLVIISPYFLQLCILKATEALESVGAYPSMLLPAPPPTSTLQLRGSFQVCFRCLGAHVDVPRQHECPVCVFFILQLRTGVYFTWSR